VEGRDFHAALFESGCDGSGQCRSVFCCLGRN
jgi:hypothetical protein